MKKIEKNNNETGQKYVNILGINVISTTEDKLLASIRNRIAHSEQFYITTPNPELVLASTHNYSLKDALNSSDFAVPDAVGLSQASKYLTLKAPSNIILRLTVSLFQGLIVGAATFLNRDWLDNNLRPIKGRVLFVKLIQLANEKGWRVFFLGGESDEAVKASEKLRLNYKNVKIEAFPGPMVNDNADPKTEDDKKLETEAIDMINKFAPQLLFVAMKNPKQEIWIYKNLKKLKVGGAMTLGGTFRYISGMSKLPPRWMEKAGLEWLWRLITEPKRLGRVLNAFPIFPLRVFWFKVTGN